MGEGRVLLLGETNPYGPNPEFALYCEPPGCSGIAYDSSSAFRKKPTWPCTARTCVTGPGR